MPTSLLCPACSKPATFARGPIAACPSCGTPYPEALRTQAEWALARDLRRRPLLLTIGLLWSTLMGGISLLFLGLAPFDIGSYSINNELVSGPEFLRRIGILWAAFAVTSIGVAYALWKEQSWARVAILFWWLVVTVMLAVSATQDGQSILSGLFTGFVGSGLAAWYLYGRSDVRAYFNVLESKPGAE